MLSNQAVEMNIDEIKSWSGAPMSEQTRLDMLGLQRLAKQRVVVQIDLPHGEIIRRPPIRIHSAQLVCREHLGWYLGGSGTRSIHVVHCKLAFPFRPHSTR